VPWWVQPASMASKTCRVCAAANYANIKRHNSSVIIVCNSQLIEHEQNTYRQMQLRS
jgi:hypothetical protein